MKIIALILLSLTFTAIADELPTPHLILDKKLSDLHEQKAATPSADLPDPNLILERGLVYTPKTRIRHRIISGGTNLPQFRAVPESEYWRGN